jgi:hypothetical protein
MSLLVKGVDLSSAGSAAGTTTPSFRVFAPVSRYLDLFFQ